MDPAGVVGPEVVEEPGAGLCLGERRALGVDLLGLERGEPGLHHCVVIAALALSDGNLQAVAGGEIKPLARGELVATVGVDDTAWWWAPDLKCLAECSHQATRERVAHVGGPLLLTAAALGASSYISDPVTTMVLLTIAAIGVFCTFAVFWTLPTAWLSGTAAAGAIALINSIGNLAGFGGPYLVGWVKEATGSTSTGLLVLSLLPLAAGLLVFLAGHDTKTEFAGVGHGK